MIILNNDEINYLNNIKPKINCSDFNERIDNNKNTLIMRIAATKKISIELKCEIINFLIGKCDINLQNKNGKTALMLSLIPISKIDDPSQINRSVIISNLLLMIGANTGLTDKNMNNFLMLFLPKIDCCNKDHMTLLNSVLHKMMYEENCNINQKNSMKMSALDIAIFNRSGIEVIKLLMMYGANINLTDITILEKLYKTCFSDFVQFNLLVQFGFDIKRKTESGLNILMLLFTTTTPDKHIFTRVMIDNNININEQDERGNTAIFHAIHHKTDFLILMQYHNIDLTIVNNRGYNILNFLSNYTEKSYYNNLIMLIPELSKMVLQKQRQI